MAAGSSAGAEGQELQPLTGAGSQVLSPYPKRKVEAHGIFITLSRSHIVLLEPRSIGGNSWKGLCWLGDGTQTSSLGGRQVKVTP